ncbi:MAG: OmpH family outer membrane protein [Muribaculaceae bacterium]|nr:OmpH family outer membrane protein [Muribaculaceae bacterium]
MIKKLILALLVALPLSAAAQKFGTVDIDQVLQVMPEVADMQRQITEASQKYEAEFQKLVEEVNKLYTEFQSIAEDPATPQTIKERRMQEIQDRQQKVEQFRNTATQDLQRQQEQLMGPIQARLTEAIKAVGQEGSFTFIFPNDPSLVLYQGTDVVDVTATVKAKLGIK